MLQVTSNETNLVARCRRVYAHAHDYHINSISNNRYNNLLISSVYQLLLLLHMFECIVYPNWSLLGLLQTLFSNSDFSCPICLIICWKQYHFCSINGSIGCLSFVWVCSWTSSDHLPFLDDLVMVKHLSLLTIFG